jgi:transposase
MLKIDSFSFLWKSLQLGRAKSFMDEHNIIQTTKKDQVFFQRWVTGSTIARWSEYAELNWKLSEKKFQFGLLLKILAQPKHVPDMNPLEHVWNYLGLVKNIVNSKEPHIKILVDKHRGDGKQSTELFNKCLFILTL